MERRRGLQVLSGLLSGALLGTMIVVQTPRAAAFTQNPATVFINEIHYDDAGTDIGETIEIAGPAGTDLTGWDLVLYNGNGGAPYNTRALSGVIPNQQNGFGTVSSGAYPVDGIQNGSPDGIALVDASDKVVQFLSYEGTFTAVGGPANGLASTNIGVAEAGEPEGASLQLKGNGTTYQNFTWTAPTDDSFGAVNTGQTFTGNTTPTETATTPTETATPPSETVTAEPTATQTATAEPTATVTPTAPANPCQQPATPIHDVQGAGNATPLAGQTVTIQGIVVGDFQEADGDQFNTDLDGFYVQEEQAEYDADPLTSEGIFVFAPGAANVVAGDVVRVTGQATEFNQLTQVNAQNGTVVDCGDGEQPAPTQVNLPVDSIGDFERYEGMRVQFPQALRISEYFNFDRFGEIALCRPNPADPAQEQDRLYQATSIHEPGSPDAAARAEYNKESCITVDDARSEQNPDPARHPNGQVFTLANRFRGGDTMQNTIGILDFRFNLYRLQPTQGANYTTANPRPEQPPVVGGDLKVASFNVLNYFTRFNASSGTQDDVCGPARNQECRGANNQEEFDRQRAKIIEALFRINADIVGLIELENTDNAAIENLVAGLNERYNDDPYTYINTGTIGTDAIRVAIIYKPSRVTPIGAFETLTAADDTRFRDDRNRPALAQTFDDTDGGRFTVVVNHFKSKGSGCGAGDDDPQQGNCNGTRTLAAEALVDWLATDPTGSSDPDFLIVGDLNAYDKEAPIDEIRAGADDTLGTADDYTDLEFAFQGEYAYSYLFDAQFGYLDYALAIQSLVPQITGSNAWHINADEPDILDYDTTNKKAAQDALYEPNPFRSSDHDPVLVGLDLTVPATPTETPTVPPTGTATALPTETQTAVPTNTAEPTDTATALPTDTVVPTDTPTALPTDTAQPTETSTPAPTDTAQPTDTATTPPTPTNTSVPTTTPTARPTTTPTVIATPAPGTRPNITIGDVTIGETNSATVSVYFTVRLSRTSQQRITVQYATADGTAKAGKDYTSTSGTLTFTPGSTSRVITVAVRGDLLDEVDETFFVNLSNATNANIADGQGKATIVDNDAAPSLRINDVTVTEGNSGTAGTRFTVTLSRASEKPVTVRFATANGTAQADTDYTGTSGTLTFAPGVVSQPVVVLVRGDRTKEPNETFFVNLSNAANATLADGQGKGTILNND